MKRPPGQQRTYSTTYTLRRPTSSWDDLLSWLFRGWGRDRTDYIWGFTPALYQLSYPTLVPTKVGRNHYHHFIMKCMTTTANAPKDTRNNTAAATAAYLALLTHMLILENHTVKNAPTIDRNLSIPKYRYQRLRSCGTIAPRVGVEPTSTRLDKPPSIRWTYRA